MMFGPAGFPSPVQPSPEELARINTAMKALLVQQDPSLKDVIAQHPGWDPVRPVPFEFPQLNADGDPPSTMGADRSRLGLCHPRPAERAGRQRSGI